MRRSHAQALLASILAVSVVAAFQSSPLLSHPFINGTVLKRALPVEPSRAVVWAPEETLRRDYFDAIGAAYEVDELVRGFPVETATVQVKSGSSVARCSKGAFYDARENACSPSCSTRFPGSFRCTSTAPTKCARSRFMRQGACVEDCGERKFANTASRTCVKGAGPIPFYDELSQAYTAVLYALVGAAVVVPVARQLIQPAAKA